MRTPSDLVDAARSMIGVRFRHQGRSLEKGVDCLGMFIVAASMSGWPEVHDWDELDYPHRPQPHRLKNILEANLDKRGVLSDYNHGDVLLLREGDLTSHMAVVDKPFPHSETYIIHAYGPSRKVVKERLLPEHRLVVCTFEMRV